MIYILSYEGLTYYTHAYTKANVSTRTRTRICM